MTAPRPFRWPEPLATLIFAVRLLLWLRCYGEPVDQCEERARDYHKDS